MKTASIGLTLVAVLAFSLSMIGCAGNDNGGTTSANNAPGGAAASADHEGDEPGHSHADHGHEHAGHDHGGDQAAGSDMEKMMKGLAGLSEEDRASAMKQHFCPVSGDMLGEMGEPIKVTVKGQEVWLCCEGCKKDIEADPDKYLAKLNGDDK